MSHHHGDSSNADKTAFGGNAAASLSNIYIWSIVMYIFFQIFKPCNNHLFPEHNVIFSQQGYYIDDASIYITFTCMTSKTSPKNTCKFTIQYTFKKE